MNPIDWLAWIYGKWFTDHPFLGYVALLASAALILGLLWLRAIDKYHEQHPVAANTKSNQAPPPGAEKPISDPIPASPQATVRARQAVTQQSNNGTPKMEKKEAQSTNSTIDRSVKIGPNSNVTNSPIVTGDSNVVLSGPESRIQSLSLRIAIDVPTVATTANKSGDPDTSVGIQNIIGLFDSQRNRYRFATNFQFSDFQTTETTHRYGFSYNPEDGNDLVGRPISVLARMDKLAFNFADFLKTVAANKIVPDRSTQLNFTVSLNGVAVMNLSMSVGTQMLLNGQVTTDVGGPFAEVEFAYKEALRQRTRP